jgi:hypothetical protein
MEEKNAENATDVETADEAVEAEADEMLDNIDAVELTETEELDELPAEDDSVELTETDKDEDDSEDKPIVYDLKLQEGIMPEGVSTLMTSKILEVAKAKGLSNEQAQGFLDDSIDMFAQEREKISKKMQQQTRMDSELAGKSEAEYQANLETARRGLQGYIKETGHQSVVKYLNESRIGDHPEIIKFFKFLGSKIADDRFIFSKLSSTRAGKSAEQVLYDKKGDNDN